jgi:hypothetical protein
MGRELQIGCIEKGEDEKGKDVIDGIDGIGGEIDTRRRDCSSVRRFVGSSTLPLFYPSSLLLFCSSALLSRSSTLHHPSLNILTFSAILAAMSIAR